MKTRQTDEQPTPVPRVPRARVWGQVLFLEFLPFPRSISLTLQQPLGVTEADT